MEDVDEEHVPGELGWALPELRDSYLREIGHTPLLKPSLVSRLGRVDHRLFQAGKHGRVE